MDERSNPFLLLLSAFHSGGTARVVLWAFPKDEGFKFAVTRSGAKVEVVSDIFNTSAALKKAALFQGEDSPQSFWDGRMVDIQSGRTNLWVESFLECRLAVSGVYGTKMLAEYVAQAYRRVTTVAAREKVVQRDRSGQNGTGEAHVLFTIRQRLLRAMRQRRCSSRRPRMSNRARHSTSTVASSKKSSAFAPSR